MTEHKYEGSMLSGSCDHEHLTTPKQDAASRPVDKGVWPNCSFDDYPCTPTAPVADRPVVTELCGDETNGGFIRALCFTVWQICQNPTHEDGKVDWFNDTFPTVQRGVSKIRAMLAASPVADEATRRLTALVEELETWDEPMLDLLRADEDACRLRKLLGPPVADEMAGGEDMNDPAMALREATNLAVALHRLHYSEVTQWKPLDDLRGVISQIDNMTTGLTRMAGGEDGVRALLAKIAPMLPIETSMGPEYAEVRFGRDAMQHSSQAMTMNPEHWDALNQLLTALAKPYRSGGGDG